MITFIAESKTMSTELSSFSEEDIEKHRPALEDLADKTMEYLSTLSVEELATRMAVSISLARKAKQLIYDFPLKHTGIKAIEAFTGEVYRAFDFNNIPEEFLYDVYDKVKIISSLYGLLHPDDIIKPYRLEFNKDCGPGGMNLIKYLKPKVTVALVKYLKENNITEIVDLLPADASKCLDWKIIKAFAKVSRIDFKVEDNMKLKSPHTGHLKYCRGKILKEIIEQRIDSLEEIKYIKTNEFFYSDEYSKTGIDVFLCDYD